ncbi:hypothetical protein NEOLEDRAFT_1179930 [Neolentinus lepideus HHB14362 ss-1]|uniref:Tim44-like domain-containing protein n=1 Tax=Neolentinus lepideus HHB14362 ss-1 TaxID=1314782 RepID=A0A165REY0_9AGAM|nr:hypothetical protein NEOLEDRAFT_1179930 [Neolentinus lepideus HHB14362 ss-1]
MSQSPRPSKQMNTPKPTISATKAPVTTPFKVSFPAATASPKASAKAPTLPPKKEKPLKHYSGNILRQRKEGLRRVDEAERRLTYTEQLEQLQELIAIERMNPTLDPWSGPSQLLDLHIPVTKSYKPNATFRDHAHEWNLMLQNYVRNVASMWRMAKSNAFPDVNVKSPWSFQIFKAASPSNAWLAPFLAIAQKTCVQAEDALANLDEKAMKRISSGAYQDEWVSRIRALSSMKELHTIKRDVIHVKPTRVVSIRATEAYLGADEPKIGNRLLVQACVMHDRVQAISFYNKEGKKITREGAIALNQELEHKRMVDFLVLEKKMWYDSPWTIRDSLHPGVKPKFSSA